MPHRLFSLDEVSSYLHIQPDAVRLLAKRGEIPHVQMGGSLRFRQVEIDRWASQRLLGMKPEDMHDFHQCSTAKEHDLSSRRALLPELMRVEYVHAELPGKTKARVLREMVEVADATGKVWDKDGLMQGVEERERLCSTALSGGVALLHPPHHDPHMFEDTFVVLGRSFAPIPFGGPDGCMTRLFFLVCSQEDRIHLHVLARLGMMCYHTDLLLRLNEADSSDEMYGVLIECEQELVAKQLRS